MTRFRPCIDLHAGQVKQIVGGSLRDDGSAPTTNFVANHDAAWFADRYRRDDLTGGHVIQLGPGNEAAAIAALAAWPGGLQLGGGVTIDNAATWLDRGASHVIVTSWLFVDDQLSMDRVQELSRHIGSERLVIDLSCRRVHADDLAGDADPNSTLPAWHVATNRWQTVTETAVTAETIQALAPYCAELLIHAADVEGKQAGMDQDLIALLGDRCPIPCTYAGGARNLADLTSCAELSQGQVDLTIGSALDIFGGTLSYDSCVAWNQARSEQ